MTEPQHDTEDGKVIPMRKVETTAALDIVPHQAWWTQGQLAALASIGLADCPAADSIAFLHLCQQTGLDPFRREIYLIGRGKNENRKWTPQTGIDGFRHIAQRTGRYHGIARQEWCGRDGVWTDVWLAEEHPAAARTVLLVEVIPGNVREITAVAVFAEYAPLEDVWTGSGNNRSRLVENGKTVQKLAAMWEKMPSGQIMKCSEALAIRKAFPRDAAGIYSPEEMARADAEEKARADTAAATARADAVAARKNRTVGFNGPVIDAEVIPDTTNVETSHNEDGSNPANPEPTPETTVDTPQQTPPTPDHDTTPLPTRDHLEAQVNEYARVLADGSVTKLALRWAMLNKKTLLDEATSDAEIAAFLAEREPTYNRELTNHPLPEPDIDPDALAALTTIIEATGENQ